MRSTDLGAAIRHIVNHPLQPTPEHGDPFLLIRSCRFGRMSRPRREFDCGMRRALWKASAVVSQILKRTFPCDFTTDGCWVERLRDAQDDGIVEIREEVGHEVGQKPQVVGSLQ